MKEKNQRPIMCDVCDKAFKINNELDQHKMVHTNEPFHTFSYQAHRATIISIEQYLKDSDRNKKSGKTS